MRRHDLRDLVVLLPGITGSVLRKDGRDVWAFSGGAMVRALSSLGDSVRALELVDDSPTENDLGDGITAHRLMENVHLIPGLWKIDGYTRVRYWLLAQFTTELGHNLFDFPYDWRRDNRASARRLEEQSRQWLTQWRQESGNADAKLILVAHSMGGLVARYFLECLGGWRDTRLLVTFGTPFEGSLNALDFLANGLRKRFGPLTLIDLSNLMRSFTSVYQLLPTYECVDGGDGQLRSLRDLDVPYIDSERAREAWQFHEEIRAAIRENSQDELYLTGRYDIRPVVGTYQPTKQSGRLDPQGLTMLKDYQGEDQDGDGTVPRVSATPDERGHETNAMFPAQKHGSLQNEDSVLLQLSGSITGLSLQRPVRRAARGASISLEIDDVFEARNEIPLTIRVTDSTIPELALRVEDVDTLRVVSRRTLVCRGEGWQRATMAPLPEGAYRLTIGDTQGRTTPLTDVFVVVDLG